MGVVLQLLGFAALVAWAGLVFGWPASLLPAGLELILLGLAAADAPPLRVRRRVR